LQLKIVLYLITEASEDVESQKRGLVILIWPGMCGSIPPSKSGSTVDRRLGNDFQMAIPLRVVSIQFGYESSKLLKFARILLVALMQKAIRVRFNIIDGALNGCVFGFVMVRQAIYRNRYISLDHCHFHE
jgi:hypothetical protein